MSRVTVRWSEVRDAFDFVSADSPMEVQAYLSLETGQAFLDIDPAVVGETEPLPGDIDDPDKYVSIPHKNDLDLGKRLVFRFASRFLPDDFEDVQAMFSRKGAYGRFKDLLDDHGLLDEWRAYEEEATEKALREWCEFQGVTLADE